MEVTDGTLHAWSDTFYDNSGYVAGAITVDARADIRNSTFTANTATSFGVGAFGTLGGSITATSVTAIDNLGPAGDIGVGGTPRGTLRLSSSIVGRCSPFSFVSDGYNFENGTSCEFTSVGDQQTVDPELGPLADNGGPVLTRLPAPTSPVLDATPAINCALTVDARGLPRPAGAGCDRCCRGPARKLMSGAIPSTWSGWWARKGSNLRPSDYESPALTTELRARRAPMNLAAMFDGSSRP